MEDFIKAVCQREGLDTGLGDIRPMHGGQVNQVYRVGAEYVIRIGAREDAYQRLKQETELLRRVEKAIPVPKIYAFGDLDGQVYQIQQFVPGQKLYTLWKNLSPDVQDRLVSELARYLQTLHSQPCTGFGYPRDDTPRADSWQDLMTARFTAALDELRDLKIHIAPGFLEMASVYFTAHQQALAGGAPALLHGDLWLGNILIGGDGITAILDFEYAVQAPLDYELLKLEDFGLYPNDYAEEADEVYSAADFASFFPLLRRHYPALFAVEHLRERLNLYHLVSAFSDYLAWRKANLSRIPASRPAASGFYMARVANFIFGHGARMFLG